MAKKNDNKNDQELNDQEEKNQEEKDLLKLILSKSITSENPAEDCNINSYNSNDFFSNFKKKLLHDYEGKEFLDLAGSEIIETKYGETLKITQKEKIDFKILKSNLKDRLLFDLKLIPGIGPKKEKKLKEEGYEDLYSLKSLPKYSKNVNLAIENINSSFTDFFDYLKQNSYSHNETIKACQFADEKDFKFMDIETLGLNNVPIILIGIAEIKGNYIETNQYFLREESEEPAILHEYFNHLNDDSILVTYNGASFDVPFIKDRFSHHGLDYNKNLINYDLLHYVRKLWRHRLPNCQLQTVESEIFNIKRENDVPGSEIPGYYKSYLNENNIGPVVPIIEHNRIDVVSLASFLMKLANE
ncbi:ribonuclease H-like domain-containing protein [Methanobrevibacter curvatus]|uniref:DNA polymerase family B, exonuclease domain n=1 Tax=Methanobrevibacter curvatus TaxID=49547 RepID=A0A166B481_9EURY|nr:ribonuclease H-like domain-containing protein [Methanobrevibacter curvatus]KZX12838.1 DNA polymerase family B, exonuclease domain [Methanobrevibacter curvatus]